MEQEKLIEMTVQNAVAIGQLTEISKRTSEDVDKMIKHSEKLQNLTVEHSKILGRVGHLESKVSSDRKQIDIIYTIMKYPKTAVLVLALSYTFTIYEVRTAFIKKVSPYLEMIGVLK